MMYLKQRQPDDYGSGYYGASRGNRVHMGVDLVTEVGKPIYSTVNGRVTKLGYPYGNDLSFRYVEVEDYNEIKHRYFYVNPKVEVGDIIHKFGILGVHQNLGKRYDKNNKTITPHIHYEVKVKGEHVDPVPFLASMGFKLV